MLKDSIDTNTILIDPSALLFIEIHGTKQQSKNLLNNLKDNLIKGKDEERDVKKGTFEFLSASVEVLSCVLSIYLKYSSLDLHQAC